VSDQVLIQLVLGGFGLTGIIGAGVALLKLRPDVNTMAVAQGESVLKQMRDLNDELREALEEARDERDVWKVRALTAEAEVMRLKGLT